MTFKYHNIVLPGNAGRTISNHRTPFHTEEDPWSTIAYLKSRFPPEVRSRITVVDLGALEGGYSIELAKLGFRVTIIEARARNIQKCRWIADRWRLNIRCIQDDAKNLYKYGPFDIVLCLGLLYHFDQPVAFLKMAAAQTRRLLLLNTHFAMLEDPMYDNPAWITRIGRFLYKRFPWAYPKYHHNLSRLAANEGYIGRWFREYRDKASVGEIEGSQEAAFSNPRSFWLSKTGLEMAVRDSGFFFFSQLHEKKGHDRGIFVCLK